MRAAERPSVLGGFLCVRTHVLSRSATARPALRGRRSDGSICHASCGFRHFRGTLRGGFRGNAHSPTYAGAGDARRCGGGFGAATPDHGPRDIGHERRGNRGRQRVRSRHRVRGGDDISAPSGAVTLVFRRIAFKRREVQVPTEQKTADATLDPDVFNLEAVVVTGQATGIERRNAAIATTNVTGQEISAVPGPSLDRALAGRVPGAIISQNSGAPG